MEWISVKEKLPEKDGLYAVQYIALSERYGTFIKFRIIDFDKSRDGYAINPKETSVTHWLLLPEPPKCIIDLDHQ